MVCFRPDFGNSRVRPNITSLGSIFPGGGGGRYRISAGVGESAIYVLTGPGRVFKNLAFSASP